MKMLSIQNHVQWMQLSQESFKKNIANYLGPPIKLRYCWIYLQILFNLMLKQGG